MIDPLLSWAITVAVLFPVFIALAYFHNAKERVNIEEIPLSSTEATSP
jgi:hypothetical protein